MWLCGLLLLFYYLRECVFYLSGSVLCKVHIVFLFYGVFLFSLLYTLSVAQLAVNSNPQPLVVVAALSLCPIALGHTSAFMRCAWVHKACHGIG